LPDLKTFQKVIAREINEIRKFNRALGRNIKAQIKASVAKDTKPTHTTRLDFEINEAIEAIDIKKIIKITNLDKENP